MATKNPPEYWYGRRVYYKGDPYPRVLWKGHPLAQGKQGLVRIHRLVASEKLGRPLSAQEHTHHKDGNLYNWHPDNIVVTTRTAHAQLHGAERTAKNVKRLCKFCGCELLVKPSRAVKRTHSYCGRECFSLDNTKDWPEVNILMQLVWEMPVRDVGAYLNVSDNAVRKRCKKLNIPLPPRGHWLKLENKR